MNEPKLIPLRRPPRIAGDAAQPFTGCRRWWWLVFACRGRSCGIVIVPGRTLADALYAAMDAGAPRNCSLSDFRSAWGDPPPPQLCGRMLSWTEAETCADLFEASSDFRLVTP